MYVQTLFNIYLELTNMHHVGGEWRIPVEGCGLSILLNHS